MKCPCDGANTHYCLTQCPSTELDDDPIEEEDQMCEKCGKFPAFINSYDKDNDRYMILGPCCLEDKGDWHVALGIDLETKEEFTMMTRAYDFMGANFSFTQFQWQLAGAPEDRGIWHQDRYTWDGNVGFIVVGEDYREILDDHEGTPCY